MSDELKAAMKRRSHSQGWLTRAVNNLELPIREFKSGDKGIDEAIIQSGLDELDLRMGSYRKAQEAVEMLIEDEAVLETEVMNSATILDKASVTRVEALRARGRLQASTEAALRVAKRLADEDDNSSESSDSTNRRESDMSKLVRLPKIELPKFRGDVMEWQSFWDKFDALIHSSDMPAISKFTYLDSYLEGEAKATIAGLSVTADHYEDARHLLEDRYGRKAKITFAHIQALLKMSSRAHSGGKVSQLSKLYDEVQSHVRSLDALKITGDQYGVFLTPVVLSCLPKDVRLEWAREGEGHEDDLDFLLDFLRREIRRRDSAESFRDLKSEDKPIADVATSVPSVGALFTSSGNTNSKGQCGMCRKNHQTTKCWDIIKVSLAERKERVRKNKLCFRCLGPHYARTCNIKCSKCGGGHHQVLCEQKAKERKSDSNAGNDRSISNTNYSAPVENVRDSNATTSHNMLSNTANSDMRTVLPIAKVRVKCGDGFTNATLLFDSGSDRSYVSSRLVQKTKPKWAGGSPIRFASFGGSTSGNSQLHNVYELEVCSLRGTEVECISVVEVPLICTPLQRPQIPSRILQDFAGIQFADSFTEGPEVVSIDILIGIDQYWDLMRPGLKRHREGPMAQQTSFGWVLSGCLKNQSVVSDSHVNIAHQLLCLDTFADTTLRSFWELESIGIKDGEKPPPDPVITKFEETVNLENGRYQVALPWRSDFRPGMLLNNEAMARKRLAILNRRFEKDQELKRKYDSVFTEYEKLGFIAEVPAEELLGPYPIFYLPHRPVVREDAASSKVRPVFDASAKGYNKVSLNDCLETGPSLMPNLVEILLRFRRWQVALTADVSKAFLQIGVRPEDQNVHRFLWDCNGKVRTMKLLRVPFGNRSSPFLLNATIKHHLATYPPSLVVEELSENVWVDDWLSGADTDLETCNLFDKGCAVFSAAEMTLAKCHSNSRVLLDKFCQDLGDNHLQDEAVKVLGMKWLSKEDCFTFDGGQLPPIGELLCSKRTVLSLLSRIFDPVGFVSPYVMTAKILLQDVWRCGLSWDVVLPDELLSRFVSWVSGKEVLQTWRIPRCYFPGTVWKDTVDVLEFHVFADASLKAYGACVYARIPDGKGGFRVAFVTSKGKVAPLKRVTLPRLELLGALLGARLLSFAVKALKLDISKVSYHCWSDSTIALSWIKSQPSKFKTFVGNRVSEIQELTDPARWQHVESADNPADLVSRGVSAQTLCDNPLWLNGPAWLALPLVFADAKDGSPVDETDETCTSTGTSLVSGTPIVKDYVLLTNSKRWSSFEKALRITALVLRFIGNLKARVRRVAVCSVQTDRVSDNLSLDELSDAKRVLLQCLQKSAYGAEMEALERGASVPKHSSLMSLSPFLDEEGFIRIKGRLQLSSLSYQAKHPIILPSHWLTKLLVRSQHILMKHAGVNALLSSLRGCYWIVGVRKLAKGVKRECVRCQRQDGAPCNRPVAPLPALRVKQASPFTVTGLDYFGHLYCADQPGKKKYVLLLTCAVVRALHLELTDSLSLQDFMLAFRRFAARRGLPSVTFSDNAKTFLAAKFELQKEYGHLAPKWKFIVPRSPWHGGWWERLVRSVKSGLRKSVGTASLTRAELEAQLLEIEACVNSRPLTFTGDTVDTPDPLTPSHFLIGRGSHFQPEESLSSDVDPAVTSEDLKDRLVLQELRLKQFWDVWTKEYLRNLPHVVTKFKTHGELKVGSVVLVREDNLKRFQWPMAVVTELHPGSDGVVRSVSIRTAKGALQRAVQRLHRLELCSECDESCQTAVGTSEPVNQVNSNDSVDAHVDSTDSEDPVNMSAGTVPENVSASGEPPATIPAPVVTRTGRTVRAPVKLDL